jgi:hypothetical protein
VNQKFNNCIAIIDDGVNKNLFNLPLTESFIITQDLEVIRQDLEFQDHVTHGTICASIINKYAPDAKIISIKILNNHNLKSNKEHLIRSIIFCIDYGIRLVNLSLGSVYFKDKDSIQYAVKTAYKNNVTIIAAFSNQNLMTYPASLPFVIGTKSEGEKFIPEGRYIFNPYPIDGIEFTISTNHDIKDKYGRRMKLKGSNSFSAPLITAKTWEFLQNDPNIDVEKIKLLLVKNSINSNESYYHVQFHRKPFLGNNLFLISCGLNDNERLLYRINEKNHMVFENKDSFHIESFYDYIEKNNIDVDTVILSINDNNITEKNICDLYNALSRKKIGLICVNGSSGKIGYSALNMNNINGLWHPAFFSHYCSSIERRKQDIDVPAILILDDTNHVSFKLINELNILFVNNGYNALIISDSSECVIYDWEYVPSLEININFIGCLLSLYVPDLLLLTTNNRQIDFNNMIKFDIAIIISEQECELIEEKIAENIIFAYPFHECNKFQNESFKIIDRNGENYIEEIFNHILYLYQKD